MLKNSKYLAVLLIISILGTACSSLNRSFSTENAKQIVSMSKGLCYGSCPSFDFTVYDNGVLVFDGKKFTKRQGPHYKKVSKETIEEIKSTCLTTNLWRFNEIYRSRLPDAQTVTITYYDESGSIKRISGKESRPDPILDLESYLDKLAFSSDWYSESKSDEEAQQAKNEFIIKLNAGVEPLAWSKRYESQDLQLTESLSADKTYWKISFNSQKVNAQDFIFILRRDPDVFSVQPNSEF